MLGEMLSYVLNLISSQVSVVRRVDEVIGQRLSIVLTSDYVHLLRIQNSILGRKEKIEKVFESHVNLNA
jgi:hypothetical protein